MASECLRSPRSQRALRTSSALPRTRYLYLQYLQLRVRHSPLCTFTRSTAIYVKASILSSFNFVIGLSHFRLRMNQIVVDTANESW